MYHLNTEVLMQYAFFLHFVILRKQKHMLAQKLQQDQNKTEGCWNKLERVESQKNSYLWHHLQGLVSDSFKIAT